MSWLAERLLASQGELYTIQLVKTADSKCCGSSIRRSFHDSTWTCDWSNMNHTMKSLINVPCPSWSLGLTVILIFG